MRISYSESGRDTTLDPAYMYDQMKKTEEKLRTEIIEKTINKTRKQREMKITARQWKVYYYIWCNSGIWTDGPHLYKKDFNISKCCKVTGIKSISTFHSAIETLKEKELLFEDEEEYRINADYLIGSSINAICCLIDYSVRIHKENNIDLLRVYFILGRMWSEENRVFSIEELLKLLDLEDNEVNRQYITIYFAILKFFGLVDIEHDEDYHEIKKWNRE